MALFLPLSVWLPSHRERLDALLIDPAGPLLQEVAGLPGVDAVSFERINKPDWGIRLSIFGGSAPLEHARGAVESHLARSGQAFSFGGADEEDKWVGGAREREELRRFHHLDTLACIDFLGSEAREERARFTLVFVERLLDLFRFDDATRLDFERRGFAWAIDLGRWDRGVLEALEQKFRRQEQGLRAVLAAEEASGLWGSEGTERIGRALLASLVDPIGKLRNAASAGALARPLLDYAIFAAHAHANRMGVHATQEATIRYLLWRARGGAPWS